MELGQIFTIIGFVLMLAGIVIKMIRVKKDIQSLRQDIELIFLCMGIVVALIGIFIK
ncbi:MAG: hypothetical protein K2P09_05680 [Erysipelotrichales bacterium]|nr:hypothetical protein [Erysipelotrichales bacterium]